MPERLRLVQLIPTLFAGGLERVATRLTLGLLPQVEQVVVCSAGGEPYTAQLQAAGVEIVPIARPRPRPVPLLRAALVVARTIRRVRPHVVHAHNPAASAAAALARRLAGSPETAIVATYHGVLPERLGRANRALALTADLVVGVGPTATRALVAAGFPAERTATIFNAVEAVPARSAADVRAEFGAEDVPLIVHVGRYFPEKNHTLLLDALARLDRPFRALFVGQGPLEPELRGLVPESVLLTGERSDAVDLIAAADVFALSSISEGLPLVLIEALSVGTPVVSTDVGGVGDVIEHERTGLLVPSGDAGALAAGIERVLDEDGLAERLTSAGAALVAERSSPEAMVEGYLTAYEDAARIRAARRTRRRRAG